MSKEKRRVPKLRFPGFTEDWEPYEFKNLFKKNLEKNNGKFKSDKTISIAKMTFNELGNGASEESLDNYKVLRIGDIAFEGHENKDFKFGRFVMNDIGNGIMSPRFTTLRPIELLELDFWKEYINYESIMQKKLVHSTKKGTMMHELVVDEFLKQEILVPPEKEQQHIGCLLKFLSKVISLQQRKLEHLNLKKKALLQKLFPKEGSRYPELRFPGFTDAWEQRKLSEVVTINPKTELPDEFKYVDLESVVGTNLLGFQVIKKENAPSRAQRLASYGDVFYQTVRPYQRNNYLFENIDKDMVFSTGYAQLRSKLDSYFLLTLVQNDNFVKVVLDNCTGTSYPAINGSELGKITVQIPSNEVEANQIGKVFRGIDKSITLHQRKLEKLKLTKKALLQKLFPQNGSKLPELRFKGFTDAWEQRKFLDLLDAQNGIRRGPFGSALKKDSFVKKSDYVVYEQQNAIYDNYETRYFISKEKYNELIRFNIQPGDFIMSGAGTIGRISMVPDGIKKGVFNQALIRFKVNKDSINPLYFLKFMQSDMMQKQLTQANPGSAMTNLVPMDELKKWDVTIPSLEEQNRISTFINQIDAFITLHHRKLEMLKNVKKGLLQKMFV